MRGGGGEGWREALPRKTESEKAKETSRNTFWGDAVLFSVVKIPCHAKKIYISVLKKRIIPDIFKTS